MFRKFCNPLNLQESYQTAPLQQGAVSLPSRPSQLTKQQSLRVSDHQKSRAIHQDLPPLKVIMSHQKHQHLQALKTGFLEKNRPIYTYNCVSQYLNLDINQWIYKRYNPLPCQSKTVQPNLGAKTCIICNIIFQSMKERTLPKDRLRKYLFSSLNSWCFSLVVYDFW